MDVQQKLPIGTEVRFTSEWLSRLSPDQAKRYAGRGGYIHGYRAQREGLVPEPIVVLPKHGRLKELKLFEVPWTRLELAGDTEQER